MGHLFLWVVGAFPRQWRTGVVLQFSERYLSAPLVRILYGWRSECALERVVEGMKCATGLLYELLKTNPTTSSRDCRVCPT